MGSVLQFKIQQILVKAIQKNMYMILYEFMHNGVGNVPAS